jgi:uncharacterized protein
MTEIKRILSEISHRPFSLPSGQWRYYQEWNNALFFHWTIPIETLRKCVPTKFNIDTFDGKCYVSLVAFTMEKIRPRFLPSIGFISNFHEINLRTYIDNGNKKGVYFLNIEAGNLLSVLVAKVLSGLPYEKANIKRTIGKYKSNNDLKGFYLDSEFEISNEIKNKTGLDTWLTERYCLYLDKDNEFYRYDIHHEEWNLNRLDIKALNLSYNISDLNLSSRQPDLSHYSKGVKVIAWRRQSC